jgi:hypothetical protein
MNGHAYDMAARGQMRVSQRELDEKLSTPYQPVQNPLVWYDWLVNKGDHIIYAGGKHDSYLQIPVIPVKKQPPARF